MPVLVEVESDDTPVLRLDTPVESESTALVTVDRLALMLDIPVETEVDSDEIPVLADVDNEPIALVTPEIPVLSDDTAVEVDVDRDATLLVTVDKPVEVDVLSDEMPVLSEPMPLVTVDSPVLVEVESDEMPVDRDETAVLVDVDSVSIAVLVAYSCEPLIASVLSPVIRPAATLVIWRSAPFAPTLTTLCGFAPANV